MLVLLTFLYLSYLSVHASPLTTLPGDGSPNLLSASTCPDNRSVWDIIWSCLATIFACSWVSVHPNMPAPGEAWWNVMLRRLELMFWVIIAPELVILWAVRQWNGARVLERKYRRLKWTVTHGHFLQMGGFMLFEGQDPKGTLTPKGFERLLGAGKIEFPTIAKEEIQDRSKGDALSKGVVIVQTTWFIIQCIARKAQGLDTTQIELLTLALATLNGVMYFLWWNKPLDVRCPVPVRMLETSINPIRFDGSPDIESRHTNSLETSATTWRKNGLTHVQDVVRSIGAGLRYIASWTLQTFSQTSWSKVPCIILFDWPKFAVLAVLHRLRDFGETQPSASNVYGQMRVPSFHALPQDLDEFKGSMASPALGTVFGAIHCVGWFYTFPTHTEVLLWRVCSVLVTIIPALYVAYILVEVIGNTRVEDSDFMVFSLFPLIASLLVYILARLSLLLGAVISLRALPPTAYTNVEWTSFLPHI
ncbi:hypothetical protein BU17DRAFT_56908 [Hysterangium stoloniferum]|nr:hypothetical protein BU17DRAFT_56908 [Hysterangium stoloniferum]